MEFPMGLLWDPTEFLGPLAQNERHTRPGTDAQRLHGVCFHMGILRKPENPMEFLRIPWRPMESCGIPMAAYGIAWDSYGIPYVTPLGSHRIPRTPRTE